MRRLIPSLLAVLLGGLALLTVAGPGPAQAAPCQPAVKSVPDAVRGADAVVTVKVNRKVGPTSTKPPRIAYRAHVLSSFTGMATGTITVLTTPQGAVHNGCSLERLAAGSTYLLFLAAHGNDWLAAADMPSSSNVAVLQPQVEAALAPPTVTFSQPLAGAPKSLRRVAAPGVALVIIGLLGLLFVRRSPRSRG